MVVARNCRRRRSLAVRSSSPPSLTLPPEGTSAPICNSPITVSAVTDFPDPLSPTRHSVSASRTCSETSSMIRSLRGFLPRPTARLSMSRTTAVIASLSAVIARSEATKQSTPSFRDGALAPDPESRDSGLDASHRPGMTASGLLRFARNDVVRRSLAALPLLHAGIERVAGGVADQIDAEDRDRQQQSRPEDQRRFYLKIGAALGHDVAPGRRLRADAGPQERQDRLGENGGSANISALHDQRRNRVRHQMPPHDLRQAGANGYRGFHIGFLARRQHDRPHQPRHPRNFGNRN